MATSWVPGVSAWLNANFCVAPLECSAVTVCGEPTVVPSMATENCASPFQASSDRLRLSVLAPAAGGLDAVGVVLVPASGVLVVGEEAAEAEAAVDRLHHVEAGAAAAAAALGVCE